MHSGTAAPLFSIRDATVVRQGKTILHVDAFDLQEGEHVALLGPNGAGKSTFIQLLTREVFPLYRDEPPVRFRGQARPLLSDIKGCLGIVSATMHDQMRVHVPVLEIVCGGLFGTLGIPANCGIKVKDSHWQAARDALGALGIADLEKRDIMTLSTGQVRRVLIARELIKDPQVLVFDEPCTGLDPQGMYHVRQAMRTLAQQGRTIILVTHYPEDIIPEIGRVLLIKDAAIFADAPKEELLTDERMRELFEVPLCVQRANGGYSLMTQY